MTDRGASGEEHTAEEERVHKAVCSRKAGKLPEKVITLQSLLCCPSRCPRPKSVELYLNPRTRGCNKHPASV